MICVGGSTLYIEVGFDPFDSSLWFHSFGGLVVLLPAFYVALVIPSTLKSFYFSCYIRDVCVIVAIAAHVAPVKLELPLPLVVVVVVVVVLVVIVIIPIVFIVVGACFIAVYACSILNVDLSSYNLANYYLIVVSSM